MRKSAGSIFGRVATIIIVAAILIYVMLYQAKPEQCPDGLFPVFAGDKWVCVKGKLLGG
jgi:hypothetical protein